jgi:hypothetical protein
LSRVAHCYGGVHCILCRQSVLLQWPLMARPDLAHLLIDALLNLLSHVRDGMHSYLARVLHCALLCAVTEYLCIVVHMQRIDATHTSCVQPSPGIQQHRPRPRLHSEPAQRRMVSASRGTQIPRWQQATRMRRAQLSAPGHDPAKRSSRWLPVQQFSLTAPPRALLPRLMPAPLPARMVQE